MKSSTIFQRNRESTKRIVINRGGTRSTKTYSISQLAVLWLIDGIVTDDLTVETGVFSIVRKTNTALKASVYRDVEDIMHKEGVYNLFDHNKTDQTFKYEGRMLEFFGADDQQKLRGRSRDILFCNEANELSFKSEFFQLLMRTKYKVFLDFNPDDETCWIKTELEDKRLFERGDVETLISTYKDNPFLNTELVSEIEALEHEDPELWKIYGLGQYGVITGLIFPDFETFSEWPECDQIAYGLDFGFTNDPSVCIKIGIKGHSLYLSEELHSTGLTNQDICKRLNLPVKSRIFADAAEPKSIEEIKRQGFRIQAARKGKDSILHGINLIKTFDIYIHDKSLNLQKEQRTYKWKVDANGDATNKPLDKNNHCWDAIRYGLGMIVQPKRKIGKFRRLKIGI